MSKISFDIVAVAAWFPGAQNSNAGIKIFGDAVPSVKHLELPIKRRLSTISKAILLCTNELADAESLSKFPLVVASKWGEWVREIELLYTWADTHEVSQGNFSLSVHNTPASLFSLMHKNRETYTAIASGNKSAEAGIAEAATQLIEHDSVILACGDEPEPNVPAMDVHDEVGCVAILLTRGDKFSLCPGNASTSSISLKKLLSFISSGEQNMLAGTTISLRKNA